MTRRPSPRSSKASRLSRSSKVLWQEAFRACFGGPGIFSLHSEADCSILLNGDICGCLGVQRFAAGPQNFSYYAFSGLSVIHSYIPVHPGTAKQVMEPAILRFERRARRVKRATSGNLLRPRPGPQRAATIHSNCTKPAFRNAFALSGHTAPQGVFAVFGVR